MTDKRALIIFAKFPRPGSVKTRLGSEIGMERASRVYSELSEQAFRVGRALMRTGVNAYLFYDPSSDENLVREWAGADLVYGRQEGADLGERMSAAFRHVFNQGAELAVIIGTDIPELTAGRVSEAFALLDGNDVVIGPSTDGGYYLLGLKQVFGDLFAGIAWSTYDVFPETMSRIRSLGLRCASLDELSDIDTRADYEMYLAKKVRS